MENEYIHEITQLHCSDGELHISYNDENKHLIFNAAELYRDLPTIVEMVCKENKKEQERILHQLKISLNNI